MTTHQTQPSGAEQAAARAVLQPAARAVLQPAARPVARRRSAAAAFAVALLALALAACAPDDAPGVASAGDGKEETQTEDGKSAEDLTDAERDDMARKFASCMRDNGVDMPDPDTEGGLSVASGTAEVGSMEEMDAAFEACREFMPGGGEPVKMTPEDLEAQREFAKCMREQGIDMPDPDPNGGMSGALEMPEDTKAFEAALEACNEAGSGGGFSVHKSSPGDDQ
jgi:hypothetical protein